MPDHELFKVTVEKKWMSYTMLLIGLGLIALGVILPDPPPNPTAQILLRSVTIFFGFVPIIFCPRYTIGFYENHVLITVGYLNLIKVRLDRNKITHVGLIEWNPMKHFGGSGIKGGFGEFSGYICFNIFSGTGIEIKTTEKNYVIEMNDNDRKRLLALIGDYPRAKKSDKQHHY